MAGAQSVRPHSQEGEQTSDFQSRSLHDGRFWVHVHSSKRYKSSTLDLFLPTVLQPHRATGLALISRLLERGTQSYPSLQQLNRHTDLLYGARYFAATQRHGAFQTLRLHFSALDDRYLPRSEALLRKGARLLSDALHRPHAPTGVFDPDWVEQEKTGLLNTLAASLADRSNRAQRRCLQIMCASEPYRLSADGEAVEIKAFDEHTLTALLRDHLEQGVGHLYVCGDIDVDRACKLGEQFPPRSDVARKLCVGTEHTDRPARQVVEFGEASQGRLIVGHRSGIHLAHGDYPALLLLNLILGGDIYGRLYRRVREQEGLCYHIASYVEPMAGFLFVEAGIEAIHLQRVLNHIVDELHTLASQGPTSEELDNARRISLHRLEGAADHRDALIHFDLLRRLAAAPVDRLRLVEEVRQVRVESVRDVARHIVRDTVYLLAPGLTESAGGGV